MGKEGIVELQHSCTEASADPWAPQGRATLQSTPRKGVKPKPLHHLHHLPWPQAVFPGIRCDPQQHSLAETQRTSSSRPFPSTFSLPLLSLSPVPLGSGHTDFHLTPKYTRLKNYTLAASVSINFPIYKVGRIGSHTCLTRQLEDQW